MTNSGEANSGCFSSVLRRLLCGGDLPTHPTHPFDSLTESNGAEFGLRKTDSKPRVPAAEPSPGVVARLMGLNSLPDTQWIPKPRPPDAVSRSKSVNFADYLLEFDLSRTRHRRVRTSASFREENDFLVVYMKEFEDNEKKISSNLRKFDVGVGEVEQREKQSSNVKKKEKNQRGQNKISKLKDEPRREIGKNSAKNRKFNGSKDSVSVLPSCKQSHLRNGVNSKSLRKKPMIHKESCSELKRKKTTTYKKNIRHAVKKTEPECDPENSSPISVLDFSDEMSPLRNARFSDDQMEDDAVKKNGCDLTEGGSDLYSELVGRICRLTEEDVRKDWSFKNAEKMEGFDEVCMELERHVVNELLVQILVDLV